MKVYNNYHNDICFSIIIIRVLSDYFINNIDRLFNSIIHAINVLISSNDYVSSVMIFAKFNIRHKK